MSNTIQNTSGVLPGFETTPATKAAEVESSGLFTEYLEAEMAEPVPAGEAAQQEAAAQSPAQEEGAQQQAQQEAAPAPVPDNPKYYSFMGGPSRVEGTTEYYDYDVTSFIQDTSGSDSGYMTVCSGGVCRQIPIGGDYSTTPGSIFAPVGGFMPFLAAAPAAPAASAEPVSATPTTAPLVTAAAEKAALEASLMTEAVNAIVDEIISGDDEERKDLLV